MRAAAFPTKFVVANEHNLQLLCEKWLSLETFFWCAELARGFNRSCTATHAEAPRRTWRHTLSSKAADRCPGAHPVVPAVPHESKSLEIKLQEITHASANHPPYDAAILHLERFARIPRIVERVRCGADVGTTTEMREVPFDSISSDFSFVLRSQSRIKGCAHHSRAFPGRSESRHQ